MTKLAVAVMLARNVGPASLIWGTWGDGSGGPALSCQQIDQGNRRGRHPVSTKPLRPASYFAKRWLRAEPYFDLGLGYCKGERNGKLVLSYVDVPDVSEHEVLVTRDEIVDKPIPAGTRVWVPGQAVRLARWRNRRSPVREPMPRFAS